MSSPYLNNLIIIGSILIYIWVILYGLDTKLIRSEKLEIICQVRLSPDKFSELTTCNGNIIQYVTPVHIFVLRLQDL